MGADLFIEMVFQPNFRRWKSKFDKAVAKRDLSPQDSPEQKHWQALVEEYYEQMYGAGYFRDSYNSSNVLWQFGLDWWEHVIPMQNKQGNLTVAQATMLLEMLHEREPVFEKNLAQLPASERQGFRDHANELQQFLQTAIKLDSPIYCNL